MPLSFINETNENGEPNLMPEEQIELKEGNVKYYVGDCVEGTGTLFVTNKRVIWMKENQSISSVKGFAYDFYFISMHAVARDGYEKPCVYCQLDTQEVSEIRFEPESPESVDKMYEAFSKGAESNPDPDQDDGEDMMDSVFYNMSALKEEQFDDAEEMVDYDDSLDYDQYAEDTNGTEPLSANFSIESHINVDAVDNNSSINNNNNNEMNGDDEKKNHTS